MKTLFGAFLGFLVAAAAGAAELPGWGPGGDAGDCGCGAAAPELLDVSTLLTISLGPGADNSNLGRIVLRASQGGAWLGTPAALQADLTGSDTEAEILTNDLYQIQQIKTSRLLINVATNTAYKYTVRIMDAGAAGAMSEGFYTWNPSGTYLLGQFTVENPDASPTVNHRLRIQDVTSGTTTWLFEYSNSISGWHVTLPGGLGAVQLVSSNRSYTGWSYVRRHLDTSGLVVAEHRQEMTNFTWGTALAQDVQGVGTAARTNSRTYHSSVPYAAGSGNPPLQTVVSADGSWITYDAYDAYGRVLRELSGIDSIPTSNTNLCRVTTYSYAAEDGADDGTRAPFSPRKVEDWWKGTLIGRTYHVFTTTYHRTYQCPTPSNLIGNSENLIDTTYYVSGKTTVLYTVNADGTISTSNIATDGQGARTITIDRGQQNGSSGSVLNGVRNITVTRATGSPIATKSWDLVGGSINKLISSVVYTNFDAFNRPTETRYLDGTIETVGFCSCGRVDSRTDRDGVTTLFSYDVLGRGVAQTRLGITASNILDVAGQTVVTVRIGTNNSVVIGSVSAYDTSGFMTKQTNALGGVATYSRSLVSNLFNIVVTINPDGGTSTNSNLPDGSMAKASGTAIAPYRTVMGVESEGGVLRFYRKDVKLGSTYADTSEWTKTYDDGLGRSYKTVHAAASGTPYEQSFYNNLGQLWKRRDADGVVTLYGYNTKGEQAYVAQDLDQDDVIDLAGPDRVTCIVSDYVTSHGTDVRRSLTYSWLGTTAAASNLVSMSESSVDGLRQWQTAYPTNTLSVVSSSVVVYGGSGSRTITSTAPDGSYSLATYQDGRQISTARKNSGGTTIGQTTYDYDPHGRTSKVTDVRNGTTTYAYNDGDMAVSVTTPPPGDGSPSQTMVTAYNTSGQGWRTTQPDGTQVTSEFYPNGSLKKTYGSRTYPVQYVYDAQGRMTTMTTWTNFTTLAGAAVTTWNYDAYRGWLANKRYADSRGPDYAYTDGGRLRTRTWARGVVTTYSYGFDGSSKHGDLASVAYSSDPQSTPGVTYTYDRMGRQATVVRGSTTTTLALTWLGMPVSESYSGGTLTGLSVTNGYDSYLRRTMLYASPSGFSVTYGYDAASRLQTVTDGTHSATYTYLPNSPLVFQLDLKEGVNLRLSTIKQYDKLNRLQTVFNTPQASGALPVIFDYAYNAANQRQRRGNGDGTFWRYDYDALGQVIGGKKYWNDWTPVAGQQFEYGFDDIGNRTSTKAGGDAGGGNLRSETYTANNLNQYTAKTVAGAVDDLGVATASLAVTVNGQSTYRRGEYFRKEISVSNGSNPVWQPLTNAATGQSPVTGNVFVPQTPEAFTYDFDGNLLTDGRWTYTWDAENRLIRLVARTAVGPQQRIDFEYDFMGRRIAKKVWANTAGTGTASLTNRYLYSGWNLLAELNGTNNAVIRKFVWGKDLSGSEQGAGGVGGLLVVNDAANGVHFTAYDGNGNVAALVKATDGTVSANYEYGPFGEPLRITGTMAKANPFRFSTKFQDDESDFLYYGYRYYDSTKGRWIARDPIQERGGLNLYGFINNRSDGHFDILGRESCQCGPDVTAPLKKTLTWIDSAFATWSQSEKRAACGAIYDVTDLSQLSDAWDILDLANMGFQPDSGKCSRTVTFMGKCYYAGAVNYAMWGRINRRCYLEFGLFPTIAFPAFPPWSIQMALHAVVAFKLNEYHRFTLEEVQALSFTQYGYFGTLPFGVSNGGCSPSSIKSPKFAFQWRWLPVRNPDGKYVRQ